MEIFVLGVILGALGMAMVRSRSVSTGRTPRTSRPAAGPSAVPGQVDAPSPARLEVEPRVPFFHPSEGDFFRMLDQALPPGYRAFPHLCLSDFLLFAAGTAQQQTVLARLRAERVDFLIMALDDHRPVAAITLDGPVQNQAEQHRREALKTLAFERAGVRLLRLRDGDLHTQASLEALLWLHLRPAERASAP